MMPKDLEMDLLQPPTMAPWRNCQMCITNQEIISSLAVCLINLLIALNQHSHSIH